MFKIAKSNVMVTAEGLMERKIKVYLTRDSVCAVDDCHAPHEKTWRLNAEDSIGDIMRKSKNEYLPRNIQGGKATWVAKCNGNAVAVIAQEWNEPKLVINKITFESLLNKDGNLEIYYEYFNQENPNKVYKKYLKS